MRELLVASELAERSWQRALNGALADPCHQTMVETEYHMREAATELNQEWVSHTPEADAQRIRIARGTGLAVVCQALLLPHPEVAGDVYENAVRDHLTEANRKLDTAISLARPYLEGEQSGTPTTLPAGRERAGRGGVRRELGMALAVRGLGQLTGNVLLQDKMRDVAQPAIGAAWDEVRMAGSRADRAVVAYLGARAEHYKGRHGVNEQVWRVRGLLSASRNENAEHGLIRKATGLATSRPPLLR